MKPGITRSCALLLLCTALPLPANPAVMLVHVRPSLEERLPAWLALPPRPRSAKQAPKLPAPERLLAAAEAAAGAGRSSDATEQLRKLLDQAPRARLRLSAYRLLAGIAAGENRPARAIECLGNAAAILAQVPLAGRRGLLAAVYREHAAVLAASGRTNEASVYEWAAWRSLAGPFAPRPASGRIPEPPLGLGGWLAEPVPPPVITTNAWFFRAARGTNPPGVPAGLLPPGVLLQPGFAQPVAAWQPEGYRVELAGATPVFVEGPGGSTAWLTNGRILTLVEKEGDARIRVIRCAWGDSGGVRRIAVIRSDPGRDAVGLVPEVQLAVFP